MSKHKLRDYFILTFEISGGNTVSLALSSLSLVPPTVSHYSFPFGYLGES